MKAYIQPKKLGGSFIAPPSKSETHRALICAALSSEGREVFNPCLCDDTLATARCLEALGAKVIFREGSAYVEPIKPVRTVVLDCGESASTLRFLLPVAVALGVDARFMCGGGLAKRPMAPMLDCLADNGVCVAALGNELAVSGRLNANRIVIDSSLSSQFLSGLLFALRANGKGSVALSGALASPGYIDITLNMLGKTGVSFTKNDNEYTLSNVAENTDALRIGGDWSGAAALLCAAAIGGEVTCCGLDGDSLQPDRRILDIISLFGAKISIYNNSIIITGGELHSADVDAGDVPDLVPTLCAVAALAGGQSVLRNVGRLRLKETDRLACITKALSALGADVSVNLNDVVINGKAWLEGGATASFGDHRIAMASAAASCGCKNEVVIDEIEAAAKSYPDFLKDFIALGGAVHVI